MSAFVFEAFITHLNNLNTGTRGIPHQMVDLESHRATRGTSLRNRTHQVQHSLSNSCFVEDLAPDSQMEEFWCMSLWITRSWFCFEIFFILCLVLVAVQTTWCCTGWQLIVSSFSTMYPRNANSWTYLIQFHLHGRIAYGWVVCFVIHQNVAYALLEEYNLTGVNVCQGLPPPQDAVLKEIEEGGYFLEVQETDGPLIENRCLYMTTRESWGFITIIIHLMKMSKTKCRH